MSNEPEKEYYWPTEYSVSALKPGYVILYKKEWLEVIEVTHYFSVTLQLKNKDGRTVRVTKSPRAKVACKLPKVAGKSSVQAYPYSDRYPS